MPVALLLTLALLSATAPFATDMYLPVMPAIASDLGATDSQVQLTLTCFFVGMAMGQVVVGPISDIVGRKRLLLAGAVLALAASVLAALAPGISVVLIARALQGLGGGACIVLARAIIPDLLAGDAAAKAFSIMMAIQSIAPAAAPIIGGVLAGPIGWRGIFWSLAGLHAVQVVLVALIVPETKRRQADTDDAGLTGLARAVARNYLTVVRDRRFLGYMVTMAFGFAAMFCYISASPFVLQNDFGFSATGFALVFAVNSLGLVAVSTLNAKVVGTVGPQTMLRRGLTVALVADVVLLAVVAAGLGVGPTLVALFFCVAPTALVMGNTTALATGLMRERAGSASAVLGCTQFLTAGAISPLMGLGSRAVLTMAIGMTVCGAIAYAGMRSTQR